MSCICNEINGATKCPQQDLNAISTYKLAISFKIKRQTIPFHETISKFLGKLQSQGYFRLYLLSSFFVAHSLRFYSCSFSFPCASVIGD